MDRTTANRWLGAQTVCFLLLWAALLWFAPTKMLGDPGTLWHTIVGERMLETGRLVQTDPFSFTRQGQPWIAHQWLGEIAMAWLHRLAGLDGVVLAAVTLLAATYALVAGRFFRTGLPWPPCAVLILLVIAASSYHFLPRPHLVTIALMTWMFIQLVDVEAGRRSSRRLLILPAVYVLWANIHGGVLGGIATSSCALLAWLIWHELPWARRRGLKPVASPAVICVVASLSFVAVLVNPYGPALPRVWVSLMGSAIVPRLIIEHAPMQILSTEGAMILALAGVYLALLATTWRRNPRVTWLIPLLWLGLAFTRIRHGPLFAVTAAVVIAEMLPHSRWACRFARRAGGSLTAVSAPSRLGLRPALIPAAVVVLAATLQANAVACPLMGARRCQLRPDQWPIEATKVLRRRVRTGSAGTRVFNDLGFGGYLIFFAPEVRVYIDDRCELYRDDGLGRYHRFTKNPQLIDAFAAYEDIDLALTKTQSRFDKHFSASGRWTLLYRDATASLYARVKPSFRVRGSGPGGLLDQSSLLKPGP